MATCSRGSHNSIQRSLPSRLVGRGRDLCRLLALIFLLEALCASEGFAQVFSAEVKKVSENFVCQCGCNHQLSGCGMLYCGSAGPLRTEINEMLEAGRSEKEIVGEFITKFGKLILSAPTGEGFDLVAWTMPVIALMVGLIVVYATIRSWLNRKPILTYGQGKVAVIPEEYQRRLKKELKNLD